MSLLDHNGTYDQERVYILATLERLEAEKTKDRERIGELESKSTKATLDLNAAHTRIRDQAGRQEKTGRHLLRLEIRAGYIATFAGAIVAILAELVKHWFLK